MPLMRNPFRRSPGDVVTDSDGRPIASPLSSPLAQQQRRPPSIDVKQPVEYKMSEINDSGVYLPPSPPAHEKPRFFTTRSTTSTSSSSHRSAATEDDNPFTISRESFDSYRRSFDISARSPITDPDTQRPRHSLDAARMRLQPPRLKDSHINPPETQPEDRFEDVGLGSDGTNDQTAKPRKQSIFARFGGNHTSQDANQASDSPRPTSSHFPGRELFGRKRGQSLSKPQEEELGPMSTPQVQIEALNGTK